MGKNLLFEHLCKNLRDAELDKPDKSMIVMGFTKAQVAKMQLTKPYLIWYSKQDDAYYLQGIATSGNNQSYKNYTDNTANKSNPVNNLKYYVIIDKQVVKEASEPLQ